MEQVPNMQKQQRNRSRLSQYSLYNPHEFALDSDLSYFLILESYVLSRDTGNVQPLVDVRYGIPITA